MKDILGVLVMAYGTPKSLGEVEAYYTHIRRGRKPTPELLQELISRYEAIGGVSPLNEITTAQGLGVEEWLNRDGGRPCKVYFGMKHASPFIADAVAQMAADGIQEAVTLVLAPHYSTLSIATYQRAADEAAKQHGGPLLWHVNDWHLQPRFLDVLAGRVQEALSHYHPPHDATVVFSAHSLPQRILTVGDPYPVQLRETGEAVASKIGLQNFTFAWQSAGRTDEAWLGPDILDKLRELGENGQKSVVICAAGFVSDHLEVLYDIDIEAQRLAGELGIRLTRTRSLNADPEFLHALAEVVRERERQATGGHA